jgi:hypothetical protein
LAGTKDGARRIIRKSNDLIEAKHKLSLDEQKLVAYLASTIQWDDADFRTVNIPVTEFCECVGVRKDKFYHAFIEMSQKLISRTLIIKDGKETTVVPWLSKAKYHEGHGYLSLTFAEELKPHLLQLRGYYTTYHADNVMKLRSIYTFRIYELLKQYKKCGWREFDVDKFKELLCVSDMYKNYSDFRKYVIDRAYAEMKEKCDICFEYTETKSGRKVAAIHFDIFPNEPVKAFHAVHNSETGVMPSEIRSAPRQPAPPENSEPARDLRSLLSFMSRGYYDYQFTYHDYQEIYKNAKADEDVIRFCYGILLERDAVQNPTGWMINAARHPENYGYGAPQPESRHRVHLKKSRFVNFAQRDNDHDELERLENEQFRRELERIDRAQNSGAGHETAHGRRDGGGDDSLID